MQGGAGRRERELLREGGKEEEGEREGNRKGKGKGRGREGREGSGRVVEKQRDTKSGGSVR